MEALVWAPRPGTGRWSQRAHLVQNAGGHVDDLFDLGDVAPNFVRADTRRRCGWVLDLVAAPAEAVERAQDTAERWIELCRERFADRDVAASARCSQTLVLQHGG